MTSDYCVHARRLVYFGIALLFFLGPADGFALPPHKQPLPQGIYARLVTGRGTLLVRLHYQKAPLTVANFIGLAVGDMSSMQASAGKYHKAPYYDGSYFHRAIPNLMIQGGAVQPSGHGGLEYLLDREIEPTLSHNRPGIVSMLNEGDHSHGSQFLITLRAAPSLDGRQAVFGEVVGGLEVLGRIREGDRITRIRIIRSGPDAEAFDIRPLLERLRERAAVLKADRDNTTQAAAAQSVRRDCRKRLPEPLGEADPERVPGPGQEETDRIALEYILITYKGAMTPQVYQCYEQEEARLMAGRIAELARRPGSDFAELSRKYSDAPEYKIHLLLRGKDHPDSVAPVFRLKVGQVGDPLLTAKGYMTFRRVELRMIRVSHILLAYQGASESRQSRTRDEARALAAEILKRARAGEDFSSLSRQFSDSESAAKGGEIGEIARGATHPAFDHAAFRLQPGEISEIIPTPAGFQIIRRLE